MPNSNSEHISLESSLVVSGDQITSQLGDESVMLSLKDGIYYGLDALGTRIWGLMKQPRSVREICETIEGEYDVQPDACEQAVLALLRDLEARNLVEIWR